ncbi:hypothetical protein SELMODRAFT_421889 [Selaginella moellendorffii]|uniref:Uncharacterized protein n=1 Tax=Selaginella moellendorffii TaxID=88036 RepID=D8SGN7_SELML|nr:hypothetical protein SELMODRAFT_421889 [Selaginella moellendorffii]
MPFSLKGHLEFVRYKDLLLEPPAERNMKLYLEFFPNFNTAQRWYTMPQIQNSAPTFVETVAQADRILAISSHALEGIVVFQSQLLGLERWFQNAGGMVYRGLLTDWTHPRAPCRAALWMEFDLGERQCWCSCDVDAANPCLTRILDGISPWGYRDVRVDARGSRRGSNRGALRLRGAVWASAEALVIAMEPSVTSLVNACTLHLDPAQVT